MPLKIQKAKLDQVRAIHSLVKRCAEAGQMLPRPMGEVYEHIRDFVVAVESKSGDVVGCCALHVVWDNLAEVRSLAVKDTCRGKGLGFRLVRTCLDDARELKIPRVFALTYVPRFFNKLGFEDLSKDDLPQKVWGDCIRCHKFPDCDEKAVALDL
jgi:amino-acid N-acetyltransferase